MLRRYEITVPLRRPLVRADVGIRDTAAGQSGNDNVSRDDK